MNPLVQKLESEQILLNRYLKDTSHAFFYTKDRTIFWEKEQNLFDTSNKDFSNSCKENKFRACISSHSQAELEKFYLTLKVVGYYKTLLLADFKGGNQYNWYEVRYQVSPDSKGSLSAKGVFLKVDNSVQKAETLEKAKGEEAEAQRKDQFLNNLSTEIRSPLNIILGFSDLLSNENFTFSPEENQNFRQVIYENSQILLTLVNEILDLSRIESGRLQFTLHNYVCEDILEDVYLTWIQKMPHKVQLNYIKGRKGIKVSTDKSRLEQILNEILKFAVKNTTGNEILLGWDYSLATGKIEIFVEDTGTDMTERQRESLLGFSPEAAHNENQLGLVISQVIAKTLNISLDIQSQKGKGSRFSLYLSEDHTEE